MSERAADGPKRDPKRKKRRRPVAAEDSMHVEGLAPPAPRSRWPLVFGVLPWFLHNLASGSRVEPGVGADRPAFAKAFPRDAELDRLVDTFEAGNYAEVRERAQALVHATESDEVRRAARELLKRLEPDPIAVYMIAVAAALLAFLSYWYWTHPHAAP